MSAQPAPPCPLCVGDGGHVVFRDDVLRIVLIDDANLPGYVRVILNAHAREMTDVDPALRARVMQAVFLAEDVVRETMAADKMNVASLGNVVPHVHWHVIARYHDDAFFPDPIWAARRRDAPADALQARRQRAAALPAALQRAFGEGYA